MNTNKQSAAAEADELRAAKPVAALLAHELVSQAYVARELYGVNNSSNRSRLNHRIHGIYGWKKGELRRILALLEQFADVVEQAEKATAAARLDVSDGDAFANAEAAVMGLLRHDISNMAYIADNLYDGPRNSARSRLNHRVRGKYGWQLEELEGVVRIFKTYVAEIDAVRDLVAGIPELRADYDEQVAAMAVRQHELAMAA